ncbi:hypothetical protein SAMN04487783_1544 [Agrococcus baldri]|uniref:Uncharacterized protein n=1 Tax=Agrococcus baldri TaxID=153730 RepID=A0AA94HML8_9MICO|nr:hypothetical protein [Agrococcus baldri]SFS11256.1 hypothetical protein SAMN04487783_1544 [Agrococcus baldri]
MDAASIGAIVVVTIVLLGGGAWLTWWLLQRSKEKARVAAMPPAVRQVHDAAIANARQLKVVHAALAKEDRAYQKRVAAAHQALGAAHQVGSRPLGTVQGHGAAISLFEDRLVYSTGGRQWTYPLDPSLRAWVDASGAIYSTERSTFTRMAGGAVVAGKAGLVAGAAARKTSVQDGRELYLSVESQQFAISMPCRPDHGAGVRQFASAITTAARQAQAVQQQRPGAIAHAEFGLAQAKGSTAEIARARAEITRLEQARHQIVAAQRQFEATAQHQSALPPGGQATPQ